MPIPPSAGGTIELGTGTNVFNVDTTERVTQARVVTTNLAFSEQGVKGGYELFIPGFQGPFTVTTEGGAVLAQGPAGALRFTAGGASFRPPGADSFTQLQ